MNTRRIAQPLVEEFLGADGDLWHLLACNHVVPAWSYLDGDTPAKRTCRPCMGDPSRTPPTEHHPGCCCRICDGSWKPGGDSQLPTTREEWQTVVDASNALLALDSARQYGLVTGGPEISVERCTFLLAEGKRRGVVPIRDTGEVIAEMFAASPP